MSRLERRLDIKRSARGYVRICVRDSRLRTTVPMNPATLRRLQAAVAAGEDGAEVAWERELDRLEEEARRRIWKAWRAGRRDRRCRK